MKKIFTILNSVTHTIGFLCFIFLLSEVEDRRKKREAAEKEAKKMDEFYAHIENYAKKEDTVKVKMGFH